MNSQCMGSFEMTTFVEIKEEVFIDVVADLDLSKMIEEDCECKSKRIPGLNCLQIHFVLF